MNRNILIGFALVFLFGSNVFGQQSPGYLGKRLIFSYRFHFMPGVGKNPSAHQDFKLDSDGVADPNKFKINTFHEGFVEIVGGRRNSWILSGLFSQAQSSPTQDQVHKIGEPIDWASYKTVGWAFGFRIYGKHLAPLSSYFGGSFGWQQVLVDEYSTYMGPQETGGLSTIPSSSGGSLVTAFEIGTNQIINDKLVINYSFEMKLVFASLFNTDGTAEGSPAQSHMVETALDRMQLEQIASFGIGIGFLP